MPGQPGPSSDWFAWDFDHPLYFKIYRDKAEDAPQEGPALARLLDLTPGSLVLDLPCGWGRLHPALLAKGLNVIGGDLSRLNLERHAREHPSDLLRLDLRRLPFRSQTADGVFCAFTSWGYFASEQENLKQLQEFHRVLKPGGALLLDLAGRTHLWKCTLPFENTWYQIPEGYRERVSWSEDGRRIHTERIMKGVQFRHDIWIPTFSEVLHFLEKSGFQLTQTFGDLEGNPWREDAERWIFRAVRPF